MTTIIIVNYNINDINVITTVIIIKETGLLSKKCQFISPYALTKIPHTLKGFWNMEELIVELYFWPIWDLLTRS